jgi:two-component system LytT family response regulator
MHHSSTIMLQTANGRYVFTPQEIIRLEASSNYTKIYFSNKTKMLSAKVLKDFAAILEPMGFLRTHRTHLVNRQYIHCITRDGVVMKDASIAEISRRQKTAVLKQLRNIA